MYVYWITVGYQIILISVLPDILIKSSLAKHILE